MRLRNINLMKSLLDVIIETIDEVLAEMEKEDERTS
jgi:hypothetical protein